MVLVEVHSSVFDEEAGSTRLVWRASVKAQETSIEITGDSRFFGDGDLPVLDALTGVQLTPIGDPEAWARNLPFAFRAGDLVASVVHDDNPEPAPAVEPVPRETPRVPTKPGKRVAANAC